MTEADRAVALEGGASARYRVIDAGTGTTRATVMILAGLGARASSSPMLTPLVDGLSNAGFRSVTVDWHGPPEVRTIASDVEAALAVSEMLIEPPFADGSSTVLFGHSVGALAAALSASVSSFAGVVVYGAAARRFADALEVGARRQLPLRGFTPETAAREAKLAGEVYRAVLREGRSREGLGPELSVSTAAADLGDGTLFGAPLAYLRSIDAIEPEALFRRVSCPVHAIQGEHDWVVGEEDAVTIATWSRTGHATVVPGADHYLGEHADLPSSMRARGAGAPSRAAVAAVVASCGLLLNHGGERP